MQSSVLKIVLALAALAQTAVAFAPSTRLAAPRTIVVRHIPKLASKRSLFGNICRLWGARNSKQEWPCSECLMHLATFIDLFIDKLFNFSFKNNAVAPSGTEKCICLNLQFD